jgi:hypothetical protein
MAQLDISLVCTIATLFIDQLYANKWQVIAKYVTQTARVWCGDKIEQWVQGAVVS